MIELVDEVFVWASGLRKRVLQFEHQLVEVSAGAKSAFQLKAEKVASESIRLANAQIIA